MRMRGGGHRGFVLITSYLILSALFVYTQIATMGALNQRVASDRLRERLQAVDMCQGALEQLSEDLSYFLQVYVYQLGGIGQWAQGDATAALAWLDALAEQSETPVFDVPRSDVNQDNIISTADADGVRDATSDNKLDLTMTVPSATVKPVEYARAWIVAVQAQDEGDPLSARDVVMEAEAKVGDTVKRIRATYTVRLGPSNVFRYAYFVNNYGWFNTNGDSKVMINGEVRANGDFTFSGNLGNMRINGDIYASNNPEAINPITGNPSVGTITGDPNEHPAYGAYGQDYWYNKPWAARPPSPLSSPYEPPAIGGTPKYLPDGYGWDGDQDPFPAQAPQPIPYLGDLDIYKQAALANQSTLRYRTPGPDGLYNTGDDVTRMIQGVYYGPDGIENTGDDKDPLVLVGSDPWGGTIQVNGPVVIPGDVLIKGEITGRGTIYSGRNVHVVGNLQYQKRNAYLQIIRDRLSGKLVDWTGGTSGVTDGQYPYWNIGRVCSSGTYLAPGAGSCN